MNPNHEKPKPFSAGLRDAILRAVEEKYSLHALKGLTAKELFDKERVESSFGSRDWKEKLGSHATGYDLLLLDIFRAYREMRTSQLDVIHLLYEEIALCQKIINQHENVLRRREPLLQNLRSLLKVLDAIAGNLTEDRPWIDRAEFAELETEYAKEDYEQYGLNFLLHANVAHGEGNSSDYLLVKNVALVAEVLTQDEFEEIVKKTLSFFTGTTGERYLLLSTPRPIQEGSLPFKPGQGWTNNN